MKAMWTALAAVVVIGAVAAVSLSSLDYSTAEKFSAPNVRVD